MASEVNGGEAPVTDGFALHCRGEVRLYCGDTDCTPRSKKGRALLAILAAEQRPLSRVKIIDLLWSDRQEEQARASLRTLLADMRSQFNSGFDALLTVERERIALGRRSEPTFSTRASPALPASCSKVSTISTPSSTNGFGRSGRSGRRLRRQASRRRALRRKFNARVGNWSRAFYC